ncbi:hypothetical protein FSP39_018679 [Pinctada imbricata]|uniref:RRM domain-containing protein n=1 Tax=Pinctada imbricata TaxID=66713 RepID=A0AA88YDX6_PINIB|nr:hypothetical protein FSP39_018679 [Pinctada imbricata]
MQEDVKPPHSRLFVLCGKGISEETFKEEFGKYGEVEDVWIVRDRRTDEEKGVVYIKYSKTSEAALAMEELNGKTIEGNPKPLKVMIASSKREGSVRDPREDEKYLRLFVIVPKSYTKDDLKKEFEEFGPVDVVTLVTDRHTGENKGFGYVRFHRAHHAALAFENCDESFKPKFADPKPNREREDEYLGGYERSGRSYEREFDRMMGGRGGGGGGHGGGGGGGYPQPDFMRDPRGQKRMFDDMNRGRDFDNMMPRGGPGGMSGPGQGPMDMLQSYNAPTGCTRLQITAPIGLTQNYLARLFSLIPGLEYCDLNETTGIAYARFTTPQCAAYARDKLNGFEYPIGSRLMVAFADGSRQEGPSRMESNYGGYPGNRRDFGGNDTLSMAAMVLEKAGFNPETILNTKYNFERVPYCSIPLPQVQPMLPEDAQTSQRLFIVCQPSGIPEKILRDAFCRFGGLIDVYLLPAKNYGYAKYASKDSAMKSIQTLHGQVIAGNRLKVLEAEPQKRDEYRDDSPDKRPRLRTLVVTVANTVGIYAIKILHLKDS